jgi:hypothetical protein
MITKIFGWTLLIAGILIISLTLYYSYNIFTAKIPVPEIFKISPKKEILSQENPAEKTTFGRLQSQLEKKTQEAVKEQLKELMPPDFIPKLFNLISWSIISGILIFAGAQISNLGIKLIKE